MTHVGLSDCAVRTSADYVACAVRLAQDLDALDALHRELRGRMERSAVMNQTGYMRALEHAYMNVLGCQNEGERA